MKQPSNPIKSPDLCIVEGCYERREYVDNFRGSHWKSMCRAHGRELTAYMREWFALTPEDVDYIKGLAA